MFENVMLPFAQTLEPVPVAADDTVDAELDVALSNASTLVVKACLEVAEPDAAPGRLDLALVIPRSKCHGNRPRAAALLEAARAAVARTTRAGTRPLSCLPRRVITLVAGEPRVITVFDGG